MFIEFPSAHLLEMMMTGGREATKVFPGALGNGQRETPGIPAGRGIGQPARRLGSARGDQPGAGRNRPDDQVSSGA